MGLSAADYLTQLQALLPQGMAWTREAAGTLTRLLNAWADELARVDGRGGELIDEADPRTANEMLSEWEAVLGLPDACLGEAATIQERRAALVSRLTALGGQTPAYYIAVAAALGYTVTIGEFLPHDVDDDVEYLIYGENWAHVWVVNAAAVTVRDMTVEDDTDMPLAVWGNTLLECALSRLKPAHSIVLFAYQ